MRENFIRAICRQCGWLGFLWLSQKVGSCVLKILYIELNMLKHMRFFLHKRVSPRKDDEIQGQLYNAIHNIYNDKCPFLQKDSILFYFLKTTTNTISFWQKEKNMFFIHLVWVGPRFMGVSVIISATDQPPKWHVRF